MSPMSLPERQVVQIVTGQLTHMLYPFILTYSVLVALGRHTNFSLPIWAIIIVATICTPLVHASRVLYKNWVLRRKVARTGGVLPPHVQGTRLGNLDVLRTLMSRYEVEYLSKLLDY
jgi:hypothetical protein